MQTSNLQNPYIFGDDDNDRLRLETQTRLFSGYLRDNARRLAGDDVGSILDLGCGEGQLTLVLHEIYPAAHIVGIDRDERAIAKAREQAQKAGADNVEFVIGDVQQALPDGPFDLVYASMVLQHLTDATTVLDTAVQRLRPGGHFWAKMAATSTMTAFDDPAYRQLFKLFYDAIVKLGADPYIPDHIDEQLRQHGLTDLHTEFEEYPLGGTSSEGWAMMGITLGLFHSTQKLMAKMNNISEQEIMRLYVNAVNDASSNRNKGGIQVFQDTIARKPGQ